MWDLTPTGLDGYRLAMSHQLVLEIPVLDKHAEAADAARAWLNLAHTRCRVAYRWTAHTRMPLFGTDGEIAETADEPKAMQRSRSPGIPIPETDYAEVIEASGVAPPDGAKLYVFVPIS